MVLDICCDCKDGICLAKRTVFELSTKVSFMVSGEKRHFYQESPMTCDMLHLTVRLGNMPDALHLTYEGNISGSSLHLNVYTVYVYR